MVQYAIKEELEDLKVRIAKLEAEEEREAREGTIREGTKRGPKPKEEKTEEPKEE